MTETVLVAGTASHVGKSTVATGLCHLLAESGFSVAPFKAQTMSNNAHAALCRGGDETYGEIGVAQFAQAQAAGRVPTTDHNPVLLKPRGDAESQVLIDGRPKGHVSAGEYYDSHWRPARESAMAAYDRLAEQHDVIVAEGAGSIAEINLHHRDLANLETARYTDASILLVGDIRRGGVFASLYGTVELLPADIREQVAGLLITKFRGDRSLLEDGLTELQERTGIPVVGVLPYDDPGLPAEDSLSLPDRSASEVRGSEDGIPDERTITIAVPRLPRLSNATDLEPLAQEPGVRVAIRPLDAGLGEADAVVIPGTKNTVDDLLALREAGLDGELRSFSGPVVGICGGYQLLGQRLVDADLEGTGTTETVEGVGLFPAVTRYSPEKTIEQVTRQVHGAGPITGASGSVSGYEIHAGETTVDTDGPRPVGPTSVATETVLGTYLHGLFGADHLRRAFLTTVFDHAGVSPVIGPGAAESSFDRAAQLVADVDLGPVLPGLAVDQ